MTKKKKKASGAKRARSARSVDPALTNPPHLSADDLSKLVNALSVKYKIGDSDALRGALDEAVEKYHEAAVGADAALPRATSALPAVIKHLRAALERLRAVNEILTDLDTTSHAISAILLANSLAGDYDAGQPREVWDRSDLMLGEKGLLEVKARSDALVVGVAVLELAATKALRRGPAYRAAKEDETPIGAALKEFVEALLSAWEHAGKDVTWAWDDTLMTRAGRFAYSDAMKFVEEIVATVHPAVVGELPGITDKIRRKLSFRDDRF